MGQDSDEAATWLVEPFRAWADLERTCDVVRLGAELRVLGRRGEGAAAEDDLASEPDEPAPPKKTA